MAATVIQSTRVSVSDPFQLTSRQSISAKTPHAPAPRPSHPRDVSETSSTSTSIATSSQPTKAFDRIRSSLEHNLRSTSRFKNESLPVDDIATIISKQAESKEKDIVEEKEKTRMRPKAIFRRTGRRTPSPMTFEEDPVEKMTPVMRQDSMSSPSLDFSSQAISSQKSRPAIANAFSSNSRIHTTGTQDLAKLQGIQSTEDNGVLTTSSPRRQIIPCVNQTPVLRHRSVPLAVPSVPPSPDWDNRNGSSRSQSPETPTPTRRDISSPSVTPAPMSGSSQRLSCLSSRRGNASLGHLPLNILPASPISPRALNPICARPTRVMSLRGLSSTSASHSAISPSSSFSPFTPPFSARPRPAEGSLCRSSIDASRRGPIEAIRRLSIDSSQRATTDTTQSPLESPSLSPRPAPVLPTYMQTTDFNISSASSVSPNAEYLELIRTASSMLCEEVIKVPLRLSKTPSSVKDWEEVEVRTRALARAERKWGESGGTAGCSPKNVVSPGGNGGDAGAEERERRLFADSLRDGYVLCQFMNKLRATSIVKPDARDDGIVRMSNITKFLAACSSCGLPEGVLFLQDDLKEATSESLARVARTIIALVKLSDIPVVESKTMMQGQGRKPPIPILGPYQHEATSGRASASTPDLAHWAPTPTSPVKRHPKPSDSPRTVKGVSRVETDLSQPRVTTSVNHDIPHTKPPRWSPLRGKSSKSRRNDEFSWEKAASPSQMFLSDSRRVSIVDDSVVEQYDSRQSVASSAMTETTVTTVISSILDSGRSNWGNSQYGTIQTVTTDLTSEASSIPRTEGSHIAEQLTHKKSVETEAEDYRERNEVALTDLSKAHEGHNCGSSLKPGQEKLSVTERFKVAAKLEKVPKVNHSKRMRPSDSMETFQKPDRTPGMPASDQQQSFKPIFISPPQKPGFVGATHLKNEAVSQHNARHQTHRRQSIDAPVFGHDAMTCNPRVIPRRYSAKPSMTGVARTVVRFSDNDFPVPFPRAASTEPGIASPLNVEEKPRFRRRFQSDLNDSSSRRRVRPKSHDELGPRPLRSRIESMVNLGTRSTNASASDLLARGSEDGNSVHKTLIIREEGKPSTHFQLGNCIGRGQFGTVYRALDLNTGQMVAVKRIRLEGLKESEVTTLMKEVDLVRSLSHPSIVKYEGMARDANTLSIVLEYAESGSLVQTLKAFGKLNERLVAGYVVKILEGLHYLHTNDVVHCDLKAANILTTKNGNIKLADFGVSLNLRAMEREIKDVAGTPNWMAPEVIELKGPSPKSDIWSLACTVIELLTGRPPYADISNSMAVMYSVVEDDMPPLPPCSPLLRDFLSICFNKDPRRRPNAEMLLEHPWLEQSFEFPQELRPKDSVPDIRRVSGELRYQLEKIDQPDGDSARRDNSRNGSSPLRRRVSDVSTRPPGPIVETDSPPQVHQFVKTTFSKPMVCRVCQSNVKKNAVLCAQCSLIAHSKCVTNAPPACDLQSLLYIKQGRTTDVYSNPKGGLREDLKGSASGISHPHTSIDEPTTTKSPAPAQASYLPTAYKIMGFKRRSRQSLTPEPTPPLMSSSPPSADVAKPDIAHRRKTQVLKRSVKDRPHSISSNSAGPNSLRSASIPAESSFSRHGGKSASPRVEMYSDANRTPQLTELIAHKTSVCNMPGTPPVETRRHKKRESSPGCCVQ